MSAFVSLSQSFRADSLRLYEVGDYGLRICLEAGPMAMQFDAAGAREFAAALLALADQADASTQAVAS